MTHSKTPWSVEFVNETLVNDTYRGVVCTTEIPEDALRIVACVNAIGDMRPEKLAAFIEAVEAEITCSSDDRTAKCLTNALRELRGEK